MHLACCTAVFLSAIPIICTNTRSAFPCRHHGIIFFWGGSVTLVGAQMIKPRRQLLHGTDVQQKLPTNNLALRNKTMNVRRDSAAAGVRFLVCIHIEHIGAIVVVVQKNTMTFFPLYFRYFFPLFSGVRFVSFGSTYTHNIYIYILIMLTWHTRTEYCPAVI